MEARSQLRHRPTKGGVQLNSHPRLGVSQTRGRDHRCPIDAWNLLSNPDMIKGMSRVQSAVIGAGCCAIAAGGFTPIFTQIHFSSFAPILFLGVIFVVAARFGNFAGLIGTIVAALIFAIFLFEPRFSVMVRDAPSRNHLIWMVVIGVVVSDLLGAYSAGDKNMRNQS